MDGPEEMDETWAASLEESICELEKLRQGQAGCSRLSTPGHANSADWSPTAQDERNSSGILSVNRMDHQ
ncbi:MAG: hypothetical protein OXM02_00265 [Bacteroidota bacterium]|nr:hypothetical protein [Bacteroidota bacterium]